MCCFGLHNQYQMCFTSHRHLGTELVDLSVLVAGDDKFPQRSPHSTGNLVVAAGYRQVGLVVLCGGKQRKSLIIPQRGDC